MAEKKQCDLLSGVRSTQKLVKIHNIQAKILILVNTNQIKGLWIRFKSLDKEEKGHLTRDDFLKIPELRNNPLGERIVQAFFKDGEERR